MMKLKTVLFMTILTALLATTAFAVSIDWKRIEALEMSDVTSTEYQVDPEGQPNLYTQETSIEFSGPELSYLMKLLPKVTDEDGKSMDHFRQLEVVGKDDKFIQFECQSHEYKDDGKLVRIKAGPRCRVTFIKGPQAG
jgi:hypothetical protein